MIYKSAQNCVIEMEFIKNSQHNMDRENVVCKETAKFRCDKVRVISIVDKITGKEKSMVHSDYDKNIIYEKNSIVCVEYDKYSKRICTKGIHFFLSYEPAFFYNLKLSKYTGLYKQFYDNGQLYEEGIYINGKLDGLYKQWYHDGKLCKECFYVKGKFHGLYKSWHENGVLHAEYTYMNGILCGLCKTFDVNGKICTERIYVKDRKFRVFCNLRR